MSKYGVSSGSYFPVFSPNTGKYRREKTLYLDTFHAVSPSESFSEKPALFKEICVYIHFSYNFSLKSLLCGV